MAYKSSNPSLRGPLYTPSFKGTPIKAPAFKQTGKYANLTNVLGQVSGRSTRRPKVMKVLKKKGLQRNYK